MCYNSNTQEDRNVFAIYVSYYVKVKLSLSAMGGELSLKLPFTLSHSCREDKPPSPANQADINMDLLADAIITDTDIRETPIVKRSDAEEMELGNIQTDNEGMQVSKVIVSIEDHSRITREAVSNKNNGDKKASPKAFSNKEDLNLITNYDSDST